MAYKSFFSFLVLAILASSLTACGSSSTPSSRLTLLPDPCKVLVGQQIPLTLDGVIPPNAAIHWDATDGGLLSTPPNVSALFTAPATPSIVTISVSITSGTPQADLPITLQCMVMPDGNVTSSSQSEDVTVANPPISPPQQWPVIISEVMSLPCGGEDFKKWNQYVELYNYSANPVDVRGWWLLDPGRVGTPDSLVSWAERVDTAVLAPNVVTNTTIIPPHGFAVVLSPLYAQGISPHRMPYIFPAGTVILSILESDRLGDDEFGIVGTGVEPDFVVLYIGGSNSVLQVLSTYGNPIRGSYPQQFQDLSGDGLPLQIPAGCWSVERIDPLGQDDYHNWYLLQNGSPGQAPYK